MTSDDAVRMVYWLAENGFATGTSDEKRATADSILTALSAGEGLYLRTFRHMHQAMYDMRSGELMDACRQCGLDLRDPIHSAPAPQEQAQCPSCDGLLDTAGCTCPAPPASAPEGDGA